MKLIEGMGVKKYFPIKKFLKPEQLVHALDGVDFWIDRGTTYGLVGESGCGKTTLGKVLVGAIKPTDGKVIFQGEDIAKLTYKELGKVRRKIGLVFQSPYSSLDPRMTIVDIISEPMIIHNLFEETERFDRVEELLGLVGLRVEHLYRYPHEFSGGQRQRIAIARALASNPDFIVLDEPTSALDVSVQAQILNLFKRLQKELDLTYLFISHNLSVVRHLCREMAVMYVGKFVEMGDNDEVFGNPLHPYTRALLSAIPVADPEFKRERIVLTGDVPSPVDPPSGCRFNDRCPLVIPICESVTPELLQVDSANHYVACHVVNQ